MGSQISWAAHRGCCREGPPKEEAICVTLNSKQLCAQSMSASVVNAGVVCRTQFSSLEGMLRVHEQVPFPIVPDRVLTATLSTSFDHRVMETARRILIVMLISWTALVSCSERQSANYRGKTISVCSGASRPRFHIHQHSVASTTIRLLIVSVFVFSQRQPERFVNSFQMLVHTLDYVSLLICLRAKHTSATCLCYTDGCAHHDRLGNFLHVVVTARFVFCCS